MVFILQGNAIMYASKKVKPTYHSSFEFCNAIKYNSNVELFGKQIGQTYITFNLTIYTALFCYRKPSQNHLLSCPINKIYMEIEELVCPEKSRLTL